MADNFLGQDTKFPIQGEFKSVNGTDTLVQDIQLLLTTIPGERVKRPNYGCNLFLREWDNIDDVAIQGIDDIRTALDNFEPRIDVLRVGSRVQRDQGLVQFKITYKNIDKNTVENLVFPFNPSPNLSAT